MDYLDTKNGKFKISLNYTSGFSILTEMFQILLYRIQWLINIVHSVL